jgi:GNAT superfamily N-acetyltransferase
VNLRRTTSRDSEFRALIARLDRELRGTYGDTVEDTYAQHNLVDTETVVVAALDDVPVGCGCFKAFDAETVELKRFFVDPDRRGAGIGRAVITTLEAWAKELGYRAAVLETGVEQARAIALYEGAGYARILNYGPYVDLPLSICMRKPL